MSRCLYLSQSQRDSWKNFDLYLFFCFLSDVVLWQVSWRQKSSCWAFDPGCFGIQEKHMESVERKGANPSPKSFCSLFHRENGGTLGMVTTPRSPLKGDIPIYLIITHYLRCILGLVIKGPPSQGAPIPRGPPTIFPMIEETSRLWQEDCAFSTRLKVKELLNSRPRATRRGLWSGKSMMNHCTTRTVTTPVFC